MLILLLLNRYIMYYQEYYDHNQYYKISKLRVINGYTIETRTTSMIPLPVYYNIVGCSLMKMQ